MEWAGKTGHRIDTVGTELWAVPMRLTGEATGAIGKSEDSFEQYKVPIIAAIAVVFIILLMKA